MEDIKEFAAIEELKAPIDGYLNDWVFHYNVYTKEWNAIPRNCYNEYWSNYKVKGVISNKRLLTLFELVKKA